MIVKRKPQERILRRDKEDWIFRPFYKDKNLDPCSLCILGDHDYINKHGACTMKYIHNIYGTAYDTICRQFDTPMFYYIARARRNRKDVNEEV